MNLAGDRRKICGRGINHHSKVNCATLDHIGRMAMIRFTGLVFCLIVWSNVCIGQLPRWTPFLGYDDTTMPAERYGSSYGFSVKPGTAIVEKRFRYPLTVPPLFEGDKIVSIGGKEVTDDATILAELDDTGKLPARAIIERKNRDGSSRKINVKIYRSEFAATRNMMRQGNFDSPLRFKSDFKLQALEPDSFGWIYTDAEFVAWVDDPEQFSIDQIPVFRATPLRVNGERLMSAKEVKFLDKIGLFIIRDFRPDIGRGQADFFTDVIASKFPKERWEKGEPVFVQPGFFLIEPDLKVSIAGKETTVKVLTICYDTEPNEIPRRQGR